MRKFAVEIIENVIDLLHDDLPALKSGSLTCRTWLPRARYWIFQRIHVDIENKDMLVDLQQSSDPFVFAQYLYITGKIPGLSPLAESCWSTCKNVTEIRLEIFQPENLSPYAVSLLQNFPQLRSLSIDRCVVHSLHTLFAGIRLLSKLSELKISNLSCQTSGIGDSYNASLTTCSLLRHLVIWSSDVTMDLVKVLLETQPNLQLWSFHSDDEEAAILLMDKCASTLRMLDLEWCNDGKHWRVYTIPSTTDSLVRYLRGQLRPLSVYLASDTSASIQFLGFQYSKNDKFPLI